MRSALGSGKSSNGSSLKRGLSLIGGSLLINGLLISGFKLSSISGSLLMESGLSNCLWNLRLCLVRPPVVLNHLLHPYVHLSWNALCCRRMRGADIVWESHEKQDFVIKTIYMIASAFIP